MSDHSSNQPDLSSQFYGLNMSAQPFVPSVRAPTFQPGGAAGYNQMYGGQYAGGPPPAMYPGMPYMPGNYMGSGGGYMPHGMPYQQGRPHQMNPHSHQDYRGGGVKNNPSQKNQYQHHYPEGVEKPSKEKEEQRNAVDQNKPTTHTPNDSTNEAPVDSWEDITVTEDSSPTPDTSSNKTTKKATNPAVTSNTTVTTNTSSSSSSSSSSTCSSNSSPPQQHESSSNKVSERKTKDTEAAVHKSIRAIPHQAAPVKDVDEKENVNIVFIGHVDAGKSTIGGHLMYLTGQVDKRTLEKYEREAKEKNRETWYLSWALDTNQEERDKGKTVEVGRAAFETDKKRFTILDAPGHAGFVPNMISGTVQADIGILVISARRGEFETGFERRGQTREHAMLAKTAGVKHLVVLVNKMDDPTVCWDETRYNEIKTKLTPFLKKVGFNPKTDINYIPVSGLTGANLKVPFTDECSWYKGSAFLPYLEDLPPITREDDGPLRIPIADKYKDMGTMVIGKVESGSIGKPSILMMMPNRTQVEVLTVIRNEDEVTAAFSGDNIKLKLKGIEEEDVSPGFVLCSPHNLCHTARVFDAQVVILEYKSIICAGFSCVLHIHNVVEEVEIVSLIAKIDKKTGKKTPEKPKFIKQDQTAIAKFQASGLICMESFKDFPPMARFTLRDEGKTIAIGKVLKIIE